MGVIMNFLSVGTDTISQNLFQNIKNGNDTKPYGGLWATKYDSRFPGYNEWVDFLIQNIHLLFYMNYTNPFELPAVYFTLKDNAKIFNIDSKEKLEYLKNKYPNQEKWINFEKLQENYDGIFIRITSLLNEKNINSFGVNTLILFNLNCIKEYQSAKVFIEPFDYTLYNHLIEYEIKLDSEKKQIKKTDQNIELLISKIKEYIKSNNLSCTIESERKILKIFYEEFKKIKNEEIKNKESLLIRKAFLSV